MGFSRHSTILLTLIATTVLVRCQSGKINDNASLAALGLTKHKAKELAANPRALIHEALHLVRRRRSIDVRYDDQTNANFRDKNANLVGKRSLEENSAGEEREHTIDKRQVPDGLGMLNDYLSVDRGPPRLQQVMLGLPSEERVNKRTAKDIHENVSEITKCVAIFFLLYAFY